MGQSGSYTNRVILGISAVFMLVCVLGGLVLIAGDDGGGFFPGLGRALGLFLIAAGNLVSWLLNLFCWFRARVQWLGIVVAIQALPALILAGWLVLFGANEFLENRASDQRAQIYSAIEADDMARLKPALQRCGNRCQEYFNPQRNLLLASLHGSYQAALFFVETGATPFRPGHGALEFTDAQTSLYTCEGTYLSTLTALDLAVANHDTKMLELLWPVSEIRTQSRALWMGAQLDRLGMVKFMLDQGGQQMLVRKNNRGKPETLLRAAASGAALEVGSWLLKTQPVVNHPDEIQTALQDLFFFMFDTPVPRTVEFGRLLIDHGADIDAVRIDNEPVLKRVIAYRSKSATQRVLELGADQDMLSEEELTRLDALLNQPDRYSHYRQNSEGCVAP